MATNHQDIADANLHENKGAAGAAAGEFLVADGLGNSAFLKKLTQYSIEISPVLVAANITAEQTFTITGALTASDNVLSITKPTHQAGLGISNARISADDTVAIQFINTTGSGITPTATETYVILVWREV
jgi:hypothetical protein